MNYSFVNDDSDIYLTSFEELKDGKTYQFDHMQDCVWKKVSELLSGSGKMRVMQVLKIESLDQRTIGRLANMERSNTRRTIKQLCESDMIECLTPDRPRGKIYRMTSLGKEVFRRANERWQVTEKKQ